MEEVRGSPERNLLDPILAPDPWPYGGRCEALALESRVKPRMGFGDGERGAVSGEKFGLRLPMAAARCPQDTRAFGTEHLSWSLC